MCVVILLFHVVLSVLLYFICDSLSLSLSLFSIAQTHKYWHNTYAFTITHILQCYITTTTTTTILISSFCKRINFQICKWCCCAQQKVFPFSIISQAEYICIMYIFHCYIQTPKHIHTDPYTATNV